MPNEVISTPDAPLFPAYSQAVRAGDTVYVAGTVGVDVATGEPAGPGIRAQTRQAVLGEVEHWCLQRDRGADILAEFHSLATADDVAA